MNLHLIKHGSAEYDQMIELRMDILRRPLGLTFTPEQLTKENDDWLIGAFENDELVGCCVLTHYDAATIQLRQMAVKKNIQSSGIGKKIVAFAEKLGQQKGYNILMMHARNVALGFYQKCGYEIRGNEFIEVTVPHHYMEKKLC
ncbi:MAG: GNAT family N-acetyltransferase [Chitinophagaceae bacterium]